MSRPLKILLTLVIVLAVLVAGAFAAEVALKRIVPERVAGQVRDFINLSEDHPVEVKLEGVLLWQLVTGSFKNVAVTVPDAPLKDGLRATLFGEASSFAVNPTKGPIAGAVVGAKFDEEQLSEVIRTLSRGVGQDVGIEADKLTIANNIEIFGQKFAIKVSFVPSAHDGNLRITPVAVNAGGLINITVDQLAGIPVLADYANGVDICIADKLPKGATLQEIKLSTAQTLTVVVALDARIGTDESLQEFGDCPEPVSLAQN